VDLGHGLVGEDEDQVRGPSDGLASHGNGDRVVEVAVPKKLEHIDAEVIGVPFVD